MDLRDLVDAGVLQLLRQTVGADYQQAQSSARASKDTDFVAALKPISS